MACALSLEYVVLYIILSTLIAHFILRKRRVNDMQLMSITGLYSSLEY